MSQKKVKVGLIGLGEVAEVHLAAYEGAGQFEVLCAAEIRKEALDEMAGVYGFRKYLDFEEMLQNEELDIVCVLTPVATHASIISACARHGVNVLCEKPLDVDLEAAERAIAICAESGVKLFYGASYRYLPSLVSARELVRDGKIGEVLLCRESVVGGAGLASHQPMGFAHYPKGGPGGSGMGLVDHGVHLIDAFSWLMDSEVTSVYGRGNISGDVPETEYALLTFKNGALGELIYNDCTFSTMRPQEGIFTEGAAWDVEGYTPAGAWSGHPGFIDVHGTKGALRIYHYANALFMNNEQGVSQIKLSGPPPPAQFALQLEACARSIVNCAQVEVPGEVGLRALRVLSAIYESCSQGRRIDLVTSGD